MSGDNLISILEKDFKGAFTFDFDFNNELNELKKNEMPCPNGEFDQKTIEKYNENATKEINRQLDKLRDTIKANDNEFNNRKIEEWAKNKSSAFSKLKSIVLASVKKNNVALFSNFCSHVPAQNLYDLIFNVNKLILSIIISKLKLLVDSTNDNLKHQIAENEKKIAQLNKEHAAIMKEHHDKTGQVTTEQQAALDKLTKQIADNEKKIADLEGEHQRKLKQHLDDSENLTAEQKQKQQAELDKLTNMIEEKEQIINKLHEDHKQKTEGHDKVSQLSENQMKELEELKKTLDTLKTENKRLTDLNLKRDKFEKDGINKLVNIIKTAQNLVDVNDTNKPLASNMSSEIPPPPPQSNIPPPPPLDVSSVGKHKVAVSPKNLVNFNFSNQSEDSPPSPSSVLRKRMVAPYTQEDNNRFKELHDKKQKSAEDRHEIQQLDHKRDDNNKFVKVHQGIKGWSRDHPEYKKWESKYLKYKNKYLQLKKLHNL